MLIADWGEVTQALRLVVGLLKSIYIVPGLSLWYAAQVMVWLGVIVLLVSRVVMRDR